MEKALTKTIMQTSAVQCSRACSGVGERRAGGVRLRAVGSSAPGGGLVFSEVDKTGCLGLWSVVGGSGGAKPLGRPESPGSPDSLVALGTARQAGPECWPQGTASEQQRPAASSVHQPHGHQGSRHLHRTEPHGGQHSGGASLEADRLEDGGGVGEHVGLPGQLLEKHQPQPHDGPDPHVVPGPEEVHKGVSRPPRVQLCGLASLQRDEVLEGCSPDCTSREEEEAERLQKSGRSGPAKHVPPSPGGAGQCIVERVGEQDTHGDACLVEGHQHSPLPWARQLGHVDAAGHGGEGDGKTSHRAAQEQPGQGAGQAQAQAACQQHQVAPEDGLLPAIAVDEAAPYQGGKESPQEQAAHQKLLL